MCASRRRGSQARGAASALQVQLRGRSHFPSGLDVGPLVEVSGGPGGVTVGGAFTHSIVSGENSCFTFGGGKVSGGLLGGLQLGTIVGPSEIGAYFEGHSGFNARGTGFALSDCP
jgi:hypothetical protein